MKLLLIGSGGREHALAWKILQSPLCDHLTIINGNAGMEEIADCLPISQDDHDKILEVINERLIDFVIIGPEAPLVAGLSDKIRACGVPVFGPSKAASILEGSKGFMKDLCAKYNIPTAAYVRFDDYDAAKNYIEKMGAPIVIKQDGLAAGKGVVVAMSMDEALTALHDMFFGINKNQSVVIEEFMDGEEVSYFALTDGKRLIPLTSAQDHKRVFDGDKGPNTGGMGAYSPAPIFTKEIEAYSIKTIIQPTIDAMRAEGLEFSGVLFAGLMIINGVPKLLEYNVRFGDPECQAIMRRMDSDLVELLYAIATKAENIPLPRFNPAPSLCVVMAAEGYPAEYKKNTVIQNLDQAAFDSSITIFHAGTKREEGKILSIGWRVLGVTCLDPSLKTAQEKSYKAIDLIDWPTGFCRRDIGYRALK